MKKSYILIILSVIISFLAHSQENPRINKKVLFNSLNNIEAAKTSFKKAEKYYRKGRGTYDEALKHYLKVYEYNPNVPALNFKIAICYIWTSDRKAALKYILESGPEVSDIYYLALGRSYQYNLMFDEAKDAYDDWINSLKKWKRNDAFQLHNQLISECNVGKEIRQDSLPVFITNLGPIVNSYYDEYGAILSPGDSLMYFTTRRPDEEPNKRVSRFKFDERVLEANNNGIYDAVAYVDDIPELDFNVNVSIAGFSRKENRIYYYKGRRQNGRIYSAIYDYETERWVKKRALKGGVNHIAYKETSISFDDAGTAYFVATRRGGVGGKDIWMATEKKPNVYNKPVNMGAIINTPFDEEGVYITPDGNTLYFSSKGRRGMGGFDVYKSTKNSSGFWTEPTNIGYPINTTADELFYHPTSDTMIAIYSTTRSDSYGGLDIYKIQKDPRIPFKLIGAVTDMETGEILPASVNLYDKNTQELLRSASVDTLSGIYLMNFEDVGDFFVQVDYEGYKTVTADIEKPETKHATVVKDFTLEALKHPFTLIGKITDIDKGTPLSASLTFKLVAGMDSIGADSIITRAVADSTGNYSITFEDKFDMILQVTTEDYFSVEVPINAINEVDNIITKDVALKRSRIEYNLVGRVLANDGVTPVRSALTFYHQGESEPFKIIVSDSTTGKYSMLTEEEGAFMIEVEATNYFFMDTIYKFPAGETFAKQDFYLKKMKAGVKFVVQNILFNTGKATLKPSSFDELNKLAILLIRNPDVRIEISGHTDNVGSASINKRISKMRALAVRNYIISRGVEADRIEYQGYGFDQPIAPNTTVEGRAANRRVEVKIL
jgi:outer membrane protein OmpA-like peptidoglycan-associated protein/tetratricopeptide (TPR) repeat protein